MTIFPWYESEPLGVVLQTLTSECITEGETRLLLETIATQIRDIHLVQNLASLVLDWKLITQSLAH